MAGISENYLRRWFKTEKVASAMKLSSIPGDVVAKFCVKSGTLMKYDPIGPAIYNIKPTDNLNAESCIIQTCFDFT